MFLGSIPKQKPRLSAPGKAKPGIGVTLSPMSFPTPEIVVDTPCGCGEGPLWHAEERVVLWTDIPNGRLHRYDPASREHTVLLDHDRPIGGFTIEADGSLLLFRDKGNVVAFREGQLAETVIDHLPGEEALRFNDLIADPEGRVFAGTFAGGDPLGRLYRIEPDGSYEVVVEDVGCSNGLGFTRDLRTMYFIDTVPNRIDAFDYDRATGRISNRRTIASLEEGQGKPDGMTLDADGRLYVASFGGGGVFGFEPNADRTAAAPLGRVIDLPTARITSLTFAGDDLRDLYITSAGGGGRGDEDPAAGALFQVRSPVAGRPEFRSRLGG